MSDILLAIIDTMRSGIVVDTHPPDHRNPFGYGVATGFDKTAARILDLIKDNVSDEPQPVRELDPVRAKALELAIAETSGLATTGNELFAIADQFMAYLTNTHEEDDNGRIA